MRGNEQNEQKIILGVTGGMIVAASLRGLNDWLNISDPSAEIVGIWTGAYIQYASAIGAGILLLLLSLMGPEMARIAAMLAILIAIGFVLRDGGELIRTLRDLTNPR